jgi:5S rRNA maturation endonuclease (ribonuclease M5)
MPRRHQERQSDKVKPLSTRLREREEKIEQLLQRLADESAKGTPIIVEGRKDAEALRALGIEGSIITAKTAGKSRLDVFSEIERTGAKEVILLLDFDRRGREWMRHLREHLEKTRTKANAAFRAELFKFAGRELKDIEGLVSYMETLKSRTTNS